MNRRPRFEAFAHTLFVFAMAMGLPAGLAAQADTTPEGDVRGAEIDVLALGRTHTAQFYAGESDALWASIGAEMRAAFGDQPAMLITFRDQVAEQFGAESEIITETVEGDPAAPAYLRTARFEKSPQVLQVIFSYDGGGSITGFLIRPAPSLAPTEFLDYQTRTPLRLPFGDAWFVFWGGRTLEQNYHTSTRDQRFAYDILIMRDGTSHTGDGTRNEDYHCFGKPVFAPGGGRVVSAAKDIADNVPGEMNPAQALGNHVILDHGNGEYSFLAHLKQGTLRVAVGDEVALGDLLGQCGNSGNTTEAHIHYHLQDTPDLFAGDGLPAQFLDYEADGEAVARGEPVKGQVVRSRGAGPERDPSGR